jgi:hypothetical protein
MDARVEERWATAVRVLGLIAALLAVTAVLEAGAIRRLRADLQGRRAERQDAAARLTAQHGEQPIDDAGEAIRWLDSFYADGEQGFGRAGGLCAGGKVNDQAIARFVLGTFVPARSAGQSTAESIDAMKLAIRGTDAYRSIHADLARPR